MKEEIKQEIRAAADTRFAKGRVTLILYFLLIVVASLAPLGFSALVGGTLGRINHFFASLVSTSAHALISMFLVYPLLVGFKRGIMDLRTQDNIKGCIFYAFDSSKYMNIVRGLSLYAVIGIVPDVLGIVDSLIPFINLSFVSTVTTFGMVFVNAFLLTFVEQIVADNNEISPSDACLKSISLMTGRKMELLDLFLSYFVLILIVIVTCGIAGIYVAPLINCAVTCYYERIKEEYYV
ncbi:MAG: DUF975 family protein [Saccharofermentans sp.]|nr:DUF975 family protein [Saccharofermentans sp.]